MLMSKAVFHKNCLFLAGKYCGYSTPKPIVALGNSIFVYFNTNDRYTEKGFKAMYRAVAPETASGKNNERYIMT